MSSEKRLAAQFAFIEEIDRLKSVERRSKLFDGSRRENAAEHSWHVALTALVLAEHAEEEIDVSRVVKMLLLHDLVEIDAGDTFLYDEAAAADKADREALAAERLFGLLPHKQQTDFEALWREFEDGKTEEARFAAAMSASNRAELSAFLHRHAKGPAKAALLDEENLSTFLDRSVIMALEALGAPEDDA